MNTHTVIFPPRHQVAPPVPPAFHAAPRAGVRAQGARTHAGVLMWAATEEDLSEHIKSYFLLCETLRRVSYIAAKCTVVRCAPAAIAK